MERVYITATVVACCATVQGRSQYRPFSLERQIFSIWSVPLRGSCLRDIEAGSVQLNGLKNR